MRKFLKSFLLCSFLLGLSLPMAAQSGTNLPLGDNPGTNISANAEPASYENAVKAMDAVKGNYRLSLDQMVEKYNRGDCSVIRNWRYEGLAEFEVAVKGNDVSVILLEDGL